MDKKKIIAEGLLEQYLLGELSTEEVTLVEKAIQKDAELMQLYHELEDNFERLAFENAVSPPHSVKESLTNTVNSKTLDAPSHPIKNKRFSTRFVVAASLSTIFAVSSFWLYSQWKSTEQNLQVLQRETSDLENRLHIIEEKFTATTNKYQTVNNPNVIPLVLEGNKTRAIAYVNHEYKEVVLNSQGLPKLERDKTYQMWADVDGEMINMGIVPTGKELIKLRYIDKAKSLNITIEPAGGNDHATVENLVSNVTL